MARTFYKKKEHGSLKLFLFIIAAIAALILIWYTASTLGSSHTRESEKIAKEAIVRAAVQCYSIEGRYPESIEYLEKNYGLTLDRDKNNYFYHVIGENIVPDIQVFPKKVK